MERYGARHLRADSVVRLSHTSSIWPWSGAPKVRLYDTFLGGLHQCHAASANAPLLPPPPPRCCHISKRAAATAKIALPQSCHLRRQAGRRHRAAAAATSANAWQPPRYHCLKNKKNVILLTNLFSPGWLRQHAAMTAEPRDNNDSNVVICNYLE